MNKKIITILIVVFSVTTIALLNTSLTGEFLLSSFTDISNCEESFIVKGEGEIKDTQVFLCSKSIFFKKLKIDGFASKGGSKVIIKKDKKIPKTVLLHELGHNLGLKHSETEGIMRHDISQKSKDRDNITDKENQIVKSFRSFRYINWSNKSDRNYIKQEIEKDNLSEGSEKFIKKHMQNYKEKKCSAIYYKETKWSKKFTKRDFYKYCSSF